jgi:Zn-dependent protease with chaperone function
MLAHESLSITLAAWLAETTLVASALALLVYLITRIGKPGPAVRHMLWLVVLIKLMTPPIVHWPWSRPLGRLASMVVEATPPEPIRFEIRPFPLPDPMPGGPDIVAFEPCIDGDERPPEAGMTWPSAGGWFLSIWLVGSVAVGAHQLRRIVRFHRLFGDAQEAPPWLVAEAQEIGRRLSVGVPTIKVLDRLGTPILWCLGRPVLLVPSGLLKTLEADRWRGVLAHELAHLRRGDPWVGRLELVALLVWWWNPLYWLARRQVDFEAEVACDAWVLWALPEDRIGYAESLVRICTSPFPAKTPAPALGVAGAGRSFERRLIMILRERVSHSVSLPGLLAATFLAAIASPSWTLGDDKPAPAGVPEVRRIVVAGDDEAANVNFIVLTDDEDDDAKGDKKEAKKGDKKEAKKDDPAKARPKMKIEVWSNTTGGGPETTDLELQKKMAGIQEKIGKEMEKKFGPGSEFQKKMKGLGEEMEGKFGFGSEVKIEILGGDLGPEFARQMKELGDQMSREIAAGADPSEEAKKLAKVVKGRIVAMMPRTLTVEATKAKTEAPAKPKAKSDEKRARRIEILESRIEDMMKELKELKTQGAGKERDEEEEDGEPGQN